MTLAEAKALLDAFKQRVYKELKEKPHGPLEIRQAEEKIAAYAAELRAQIT